MTEEFSDASRARTEPRLLEREGVLGELDAALSRVRGGSGGVVLIQGPAGIGKTRLLDESRERARALGLDVLAARGGPLERGYGFGIVRQLLETPLARASPDDRRELLAGAAALAEPVFSVPKSAQENGADTQSILHGLYWLVANLAERSALLLAIDDLQWADEPSLRFLLYLARRLEGIPVGLALAVRSGEVSTQPELLRALRLEAQPPVIEPRALSPQASRTMAAEGLGRAVPDDLGRACHAATRGNPFLLTELVHELRDAPEDTDPAGVEYMASERVAATILLRIGRVGPSAAALVRATSVLGESAEPETAAALAELTHVAALELAEALARAEILERGPPSRQLRFAHPLVRAAVYEDMPRSERARLHTGAAALLARRGDTDAAATHLLLSDPAGEEATVELLRKAARAAMARGAPETAAEFLRRAEREPPLESIRPALLLELGAAAFRAGHADGVELLRNAFRSAAGQPDRALAGLELAFALGVSRSQSAEVIATLEDAREGLRDEELCTLLDARLLMFAISVPAARTRLAAHLRHARTALDGPSSHAPLVLLSPLTADLLIAGGTAADVARLAERALAGGELMRRDIATESDFALAALTSLIHAGGLRAAKLHVDDGIAHARARGSPFAMARIAAFRAWVYWRLGELATAESDAQTALSVEAAWGIPHVISTTVLAEILIERGDHHEAHGRLGDIDVDPAILEVLPNQIVRETRARLLIAEGQPRDALARLRAYERWQEQSGLGSGMGAVAWRSLAALAHMQLGEVEQARELAARELQLAREFAAAPRLGAALRASGIVERGIRGVALLEEAVSVLEASGARLDHARTLVDLGALRSQCGPRTLATEALRAGMELAHRCTATRLVESAATHLRQAGARPRRIALSGRASLTPGERRVAHLAAEGMTNKEIAQALFVTLRTVEMHLSNAYRKLDIASRDELPAALATD